MTCSHTTYRYCTAEVVAWSQAPYGEDVLTFKLEYPRFIHAQMMAHRMAARNAQSSRAVPVQKIIDFVRDDGVLPIRFGANQPGMVADQDVDQVTGIKAKAAWIKAMCQAADSAEKLVELGVHKQVANRLLEPFTTITVLMTLQRQWLDHFLNLRLSHDAQPEIQALAAEMARAVGSASPSKCQMFNWHLPFITDEEWRENGTDRLRKMSAARCARVSYLNFGGEADAEKDLRLADRLLADEHMSPFEHQVKPRSGEYGIYDGWQSYRWELEND